MSYKDKVAENKMVAEKCLGFKAYNAGVTRAYYAAFLHIKDYLISNQFNYAKFLQQRGSNDRIFSHGTLRSATVSCLMSNGKNPVDVYKLIALDNMYNNRRIADYESDNILESDLIDSLAGLKTVLAVVA
jgi:uncharacterized protein (UPF0332 family)